MTPIDRRAAELQRDYPDALEPRLPYWWLVTWAIARPTFKVACMTLVGAPAVLVNIQGLDMTPAMWATLGLSALAAGYALSEMSPGFRSKESTRRMD